MQIDDCFQFGYVLKRHGLKGEVYVFLDVDLPQDYQDLESCYIVFPNTNTLIPYLVEQIQIKGNKAILKFEGIDNADLADNLKSCKLYLPLDSLPELDEDQFYYHEIIDFQVHDQKLGKLGTVKEVYELPQQDLINMNYQDKEVLIPINDEILKKVDRERKELHVSLPEGLLDIYL